jgi:23S rRNA (adenine-N6)-dimethyltransferase
MRRRSYGQNFIGSAAFAAELVEGIGLAVDETVVELGAGNGILTQQLASRAGRVIAIELDAVWAARLRERFSATPNVTVLEEDLLGYEMLRSDYRAFGNIPFNLTTSLLHHLLDRREAAPSRADLIVQKEVARKRADEKRTNRLNLSWQPFFGFRVSRTIPARMFRPVPHVDAALLTIERRSRPLLDPAKRTEFLAFVDAGFSHGGLALRGLRPLFTKPGLQRARSEFGISGTTTSASLGLTTWVALFRRWLPEGAL